MPHHIEFEPIGRRGPCAAEGTLLDAARELGVDLVSLCGGQGTCGRCKVQLLEGQLSPLTPMERERLSPQELQAGYRLACCAYPRSDVKLAVPPESLSTPQRTQVEGQAVSVALDPMIQYYQLQMSPPSLNDLASDARRTADALEQQHGVHCTTIDIALLRDISPALRDWGWRAQAAIRNGECIALHPWDTRHLGLAVDLGTTKVAGYLVDLDTGDTLASQGLMNPQIAYGEDVISRITCALESSEKAGEMQQLAVEAIALLSEELTTRIGATPNDIVDAVVVGNTAMHHLLLRLPVEQLVRAPYVPAVSSALDIKARDIGLCLAQGAYLHLLPNIAGYVGADHVAMILSMELWKAEGTVLALDIGTNTEICLSNHGALSSVSCASGPAFEGAHIKHGMRAAAGAIERLRLVGDEVQYHTIGASPPVGLCGSGVLDALAQLYLAGVIDHSGRMAKDHPRVRINKGQPEFVLIGEPDDVDSPCIAITQHDVRELQLAKGAMHTGIQVLLEAHGLSGQDIDEVIIAGAFGSYIDISNAIAVGMLPSLPLERFRQVGNAAGTGARMALVSRAQRAEAVQIARRVRYIELASVANFQNLFAQSMYLGE